MSNKEARDKNDENKWWTSLYCHHRYSSNLSHVAQKHEANKDEGGGREDFDFSRASHACGIPSPISLASSHRPAGREMHRIHLTTVRSVIRSSSPMAVLV
jgi:hypothetical protein